MSKEGIWKKIYLVYMIHLQCKTKSKQDRSMPKEAKFVIYLWSSLSPKHMQDIFINSFRTCIYSHGTYPNPFLNFWLKMYGSFKAEEGNHRHWILSGNGKRERLGFCSIKKCDDSKWTDPWPFIPSCLGDHTHWAIGSHES